MAPKRKPSVRPASGRPKSHPRPRPRPSPASQEWWMLGEFTATQDTEPGVLETVMLHPTTFPNTPYSAACAHFTHRREVVWEFDVHITTASTTGVRAAVGVIPDPNWDPRAVSRSMLWGMVGNGMAKMVAGTGTHSRDSRLRVRGATDRLSNAQPSQGNWLGYSCGMFTCMLLDPIQGVTGNFHVTIVVLARVQLQCTTPVPGFLAWASNFVEPKIGKYWIRVKQADQSMPLNSHTASAWLAGGKYLRLAQDVVSAVMADKWVMFGVYTVSHHGIQWENNDQVKHDPRYYVLWHEPGSGVAQMIGFEDLANAQSQAAGSTGMVPHGAELCVSYNGNAKWNERFESVANGTSLLFTLIWRSGNAYEASVPATLTRASGDAARPSGLMATGPSGMQCGALPEVFSRQGGTDPLCLWRRETSSPAPSIHSAPPVLTTGESLWMHSRRSSVCSDPVLEWDLEPDETGSMCAVAYPAPVSSEPSTGSTLPSEAAPSRPASSLSRLGGLFRSLFF